MWTWWTDCDNILILFFHFSSYSFWCATVHFGPWLSGFQTLRLVLNVVCFLLGYSPTFWSVDANIATRLWRWNRQGVPKRLHIHLDAGESPRRKHTAHSSVPSDLWPLHVNLLLSLYSILYRLGFHIFLGLSPLLVPSIQAVAMFWHSFIIHYINIHIPLEYRRFII
jgi:hypothetical protein